MIDIHSHILPHIDDGSRYILKSVEDAKKAAREGITHMVLTPHHGVGSYRNTRGKILDATRRLHMRLHSERVPVKVLAGQQPLIFENMIQGLENGELCTLADRGQYLLIDLPKNSIPTFAADELLTLQQHGIIPVLAQPEKNKAIQSDPDWLFDLVQSGIAVQLAAGSLLGDYGGGTKKFAYQLAKCGLTHFIGSDTHGGRKHRLQKSYQEIARKFGSQKVDYYKDNADLLIHSQHIEREDPVRLSGKRVFLWTANNKYRVQ
ncbi:tyrosine-protein phosphatase [Geomicrobium sp. JSM 1781026]|uniref:tyrosine-protein phosphatase n=1 Tax=Geomicrobium sp. JSM 1781026 TaxID=3344580 RepID=UPI0035C1EEDD